MYKTWPIKSGFQHGQATKWNNWFQFNSCTCKLDPHPSHMLGCLQAKMDQKFHKNTFCIVFWLWQRCVIVGCLNHIWIFLIDLRWPFSYVYIHCSWFFFKMFHSHAKMDFGKFVHYRAFKSLLKYISCYEMAWKPTVMVQQHVIEFLVEKKCCSLNFFI
jgi:hypothetical protein